MRRRFLLLATLLAGIGTPGTANIVVPPTFEQLMSESTLVVIGTVTDLGRAGRNGRSSTATLNIHRTLKGADLQTLTVSTSSRIAELDPRCCEVGATYIMFLRGPGTTDVYASAWGLYGMVRIAGPQQPYVVLPGGESRQRN